MLCDFLDLFDWVGEWCDVGGVDCLYLFDEVEEFIELVEYVFGVGVGYFELC